MQLLSPEVREESGLELLLSELPWKGPLSFTAPTQREHPVLGTLPSPSLLCFKGP